MKHTGLFIVVLLLAIGSLFVGLQMGKSQLNQVQTKPPTAHNSDEDAEQNNSASVAKVIDSSSIDLVAELKQEIEHLKQQLDEKNTLIDSMNASLGLLEQQVELAYNEIDEAGQATSPFHQEPDAITAEQASVWVPAAYADIVSSQQGEMVSLFKRHHQAEIDPNWASEREQALLDSFALSEYADMVNISAVNCKTTTCEIRGIELKPNGWMLASQQLQGSELGNNVSSWSYLASANDGETLIYMLSEAKEAGSEGEQSQ